MKELQVQDYIYFIPRIQSADINTMFALTVLERKSKGKVYVEDKEDPAYIYIINSYGMALLYGTMNNEAQYEQLLPYLLNLDKSRRSYEWLQIYPLSLTDKIEAMIGDDLNKKDPEEQYNPANISETNKVIEYQRINYLFHKESYLFHKESYLTMMKSQIGKNYHIINTTEDIYNKLGGSVVPKYFWNNFSDFNNNGVGFTLLSEDNLPLSTAFASFIIGDRLEIGIETSSTSRGSGFATAVCMELIEYCITNGYEPVWSCNSGNLGSRHLAEKLGFREAKRIPYYRLPAVIE